MAKAAANKPDTTVVRTTIVVSIDDHPDGLCMVTFDRFPDTVLQAKDRAMVLRDIGTVLAHKLEPAPAQ